MAGRVIIAGIDIAVGIDIAAQVRVGHARRRLAGWQDGRSIFKKAGADVLLAEAGVEQDLHVIVRLEQRLQAAGGFVGVVEILLRLQAVLHIAAALMGGKRGAQRHLVGYRHAHRALEL